MTIIHKSGENGMIKKILLVCFALLVLFQIHNGNSTASAAKTYSIIQEDTGRSFVPVRYVAETFGYSVQWDSKLGKVIISNKSDVIQFTVDSKKAYLNGSLQMLDAATFNLAGTVYIPLRYATETLGTQIQWTKDNKIILKNASVETSIETVPLKRIEKALKNPITTGSSKVATSTKTISLNTVYIDLYHPKVKLDAAYANNKIGSIETLKSMAERTKATVAVNGTFFNAYSENNVQVPYGYIVKDGNVIHRASGDKRAVFVYTTAGEAKVVDGEKELKVLLEEGNVQTALQAGPRLVRNGKVDTNPEAEGFKDPKVLTSRAARSAIGVTTEGKLLIVTTTAANMKELAEAMIKLGAVEAMNLDGGASSGLYANGKYITTPGRNLSNALIANFSS